MPANLETPFHRLNQGIEKGGQMAQAKNGDQVKVHYTGKLEDGTVFDSSRQRDPFEFNVGDGRLIPAFENAVVGMSPGETKEVKIEADQAYGPYHKELVQAVDKSYFPENMDVQVGLQFKVKHTDDQTIVFKVVKIEGEKITLDANHPLAGQDLLFDIELMEIA
jgi:FKBP-type peptidyl-prolyl cis-trans isomerase 2